MGETTIEHSLSGTAVVSPKKLRAAQKVLDFDWEIAKERHSERVYDFLVANFDRSISEEDYVQQVVLLRKLNLSNGVFKGRRRTYGKQTTPGTARREYRELKELFGFFKTA